MDAELEPQIFARERAHLTVEKLLHSFGITWKSLDEYGRGFVVVDSQPGGVPESLEYLSDTGQVLLRWSHEQCNIVSVQGQSLISHYAVE